MCCDHTRAVSNIVKAVCRVSCRPPIRPPRSNIAKMQSGNNACFKANYIAYEQMHCDERNICSSATRKMII